MKVEIDIDKKVFFVTLLLMVKKETDKKHVEEHKRELYQYICKSSKDEHEAIIEATLKAQQKWHILKTEAKTVSLLTPKIFL